MTDQPPGGTPPPPPERPAPPPPPSPAAPAPPPPPAPPMGGPPAPPMGGPPAGPTASPPAPPPAAAPPPTFDVAAFTGRFLPGELLILAGALIVLGTEILFWWLLATVPVRDSLILLAVLMLAAVLLQRMVGVDMGGRYIAALLVLGAAIGFLALDDFVGEIRRGALGAGGGTFLLVNLLEWVGGALAAAGAFLLWRPPRTMRA